MMLLVFTSDSRLRYKQDAMDCMAYPPRHLICFSYDERHVDNAITNHGTFLGIPHRTQRDIQDTVVIVYAETHRGADGLDFLFHPIRLGDQYTVSAKGSRIRIAIRLAGFPYYTPATPDSDTCPPFHDAIKALQNCPSPDSTHSDTPGLFALRPSHNNGANLMSLINARDKDDHHNWESVAHHLGQTKTFARSSFFRISDIAVPRRWGTHPYWRRASITRLSNQTQYDLLPGSHAILFCSVLTPSSTKPPGLSFTITTSGEGLGGAWPNRVPLDSRHNEWEIVIPTKRVLDRSTGALTIRAETEHTAALPLSPDLVVLFTVALPRYIVPLLFAYFIIGGFLLALPQEDLHTFWEHWLGKPSSATAWYRQPSLYYTLTRACGALLTALGAYTVFRRLPVKS